MEQKIRFAEKILEKRPWNTLGDRKVCRECHAKSERESDDIPHEGGCIYDEAETFLDSVLKERK